MRFFSHLHAPSRRFRTFGVAKLVSAEHSRCGTRLVNLERRACAPEFARAHACTELNFLLLLACLLYFYTSIYVYVCSARLRAQAGRCALLHRCCESRRMPAAAIQREQFETRSELSAHTVDHASCARSRKWHQADAGGGKERERGGG